MLFIMHLRLLRDSDSTIFIGDENPSAIVE